MHQCEAESRAFESWVEMVERQVELRRVPGEKQMGHLLPANLCVAQDNFDRELAAVMKEIAAVWLGRRGWSRGSGRG